jgi:putative transposase
VKIENGKLALSKIGHIKIKLHRPIEGKIKTCTIRRASTGKWFVCFSCEIEQSAAPISDKATGIDAGLTSLLTLSDGTKIDAPKFFRQEEKALAKEQRKLSKLQKGTPARKKQRRVVARVHERITNKRTNYAHQVSHWLILTYGIIIFENLQIRNMVKNHHLAKSITDAAWNQIVMFTTYKAEYAGGKVIMVNPAYSSQDCSACKHRQSMPLSERVYRCGQCNLVIDRDHNAAINILGLGLQTLCATVQ